MRKFPFMLIVLPYVIALFCIINSSCNTSYRSTQSLSDTIYVDETVSPDTQKYIEKLWLDTIMYAAGHSFGYNGDVSMWGGWYFDTIPVGDDIMLNCDSIGPATLKLSLITREETVNLGSPDALEKIKKFLKPIDKFKRLEKQSEVCIDTAMMEELGKIEYTGFVSIGVDYKDEQEQNADLINQYVCNLACGTGNIEVNVPPYTALYIGYNPTLQLEKEYTGITNNMEALSDFIVNKTVEEWKRSANLSPVVSMELDIAIKAHVETPKFVTFSKYKYDREGLGHGMYTETFHSIDLNSGKEINNKYLFKPHTLDKVKSLLLEVMAQDPHYLAWHHGVESGAEVLSMIECWQSPDSFDEKEDKKTKRDFTFNLPKGDL